MNHYFKVLKNLLLQMNLVLANSEVQMLFEEFGIINMITVIDFICISFFFRYDDIYHLIIDYKDGKKGNLRTENFKHSVAKFFDVNGVLSYEIFENELKILINSLTSEKKDKWLC